MESNEILAEIRATRDGLMRDCAGDLARFFELRRVGEAHWASAGHPVVSFEGQSPVEFGIQRVLDKLVGPFFDEQT